MTSTDHYLEAERLLEHAASMLKSDVHPQDSAELVARPSARHCVYQAVLSPSGIRLAVLVTSPMSAPPYGGVAERPERLEEEGLVVENRPSGHCWDCPAGLARRWTRSVRSGHYPGAPVLSRG